MGLRMDVGMAMGMGVGMGPACCGNLLPEGSGNGWRAIHWDPGPCCTLRYLHMKCVKLSSFLAQVCFSEQIAGRPRSLGPHHPRPSLKL